MYEARGLTVTVGGRRLVDSVDLAIAPGTLLALVGPNGAGKSTLLRTLAGERRPSGGSVHLNGRDLATYSVRDLAGRRAVLAQSVMLAFAYTMREILALGAPPGTLRRDAETLVQRAAEAVALTAALDRPVNQLSGGEQQRVHLARVLVQLWAQPADGEARYLLLDEPTSHLDPAQQLLVAGLARAHAASGGGVLAVLHDLNLAAAIAGEVAIMQNGRIAARGPPRQALDPDLLARVYGIGFRAIEADGKTWLAPVAPP